MIQKMGKLDTYELKETAEHVKYLGHLQLCIGTTVGVTTCNALIQQLLSENMHESFLEIST